MPQEDDDLRELFGANYQTTCMGERIYSGGEPLSVQQLETILQEYPQYIRRRHFWSGGLPIHSAVD